LDGIRGFAVLVVLCHNLGWPGFQGGFLGVDVFFALSGFLITTLLLEDQVRYGRISLRRFFLRRFLRLYPALLVLVMFSAVSAAFMSPPVSPSRIGAVAASVLGYWSNWLVIADPKAWFGGLNHTWSLAVEMHFYVIWAAIMAWATGRRDRDWRLLVLVAAVMVAGSVLWRAFLWTQGTDLHRLYAGTDMRLDAVFLGAVAGLLRWRHLADPAKSILPVLGPGIVRAIELAGMALFIFMVMVLAQESSGVFLGGFTLAGGITAGLILTALLYPGSLVARLASWSVMAWLGQISYSLYLWHVPAGKLFSVARLSSFGLSPLLVELVRVVTSIAVAAVSYYTIERYFLRLKDRLKT
jgi:peptidoglycan/LPS O-acetylase OafA/YrhL